jgi:DNA-binding GntR family transcriptional regulator
VKIQMAHQTVSASEEKINPYMEIKKRIVLLDYQPAELLHEKELAEEFGMSRTPIRQAFIRLASEGLVRIVPKRGVYVSDISLQKLKNVFEVRRHLLRLVGRLAAERITSEELQAVEEKVKQIEKEVDPHRLMQLDSELHLILNQATKNDILSSILEQLRNQAVRIWAFSPKGCCDAFGDEFTLLLEALKAKDANRCEDILEEHMNNFVNRIRGQL